MPRISNYVRDANVTIKDKLLGSSYEGEGLSGPIFETRNFRIEDLIGFFSNNVLIDNVNFNLQEITDFQTNLADSLGDVNQDGSLANISINFANDLVAIVSTVPDIFTELALSNLSAIPKAFADFLFTIADANEAFANQVLDLATSVAYATADQFDSLSAFTTQLSTNVQGLEADFTNLSATVNGNTGAITANATSLTALGVRVTVAETDVVALNTNFTNLQVVVNDNTGDISTNATQISTLGTVVDTANTDIATLKTDVTILESSINTLSGDVTANASDISLLTTNVNTEIDGLRVDVTAVQTDVTTLTTTVNNNTGDIATQATQVSLLANRVDTAESNILNTQTNVTSLTTTVDGNTGNISTNASNISILQTNVDTQQAEITGIITNIQQIETSVDNVTGEVEANATAIDGIATRVTTAEAEVVNVAGNITTLQTNLNTQTGRIDTNVQSIDTLGTTVTNNFTSLSGQVTSVSDASITGDQVNALYAQTVASSIGTVDANGNITAVSEAFANSVISTETTGTYATTTQLSTLSARVGETEADIAVQQSVTATLEGFAESRYSIQATSGGVVTGMSILSQQGATQNISEIIFNTNDFKIQNGTGVDQFTINTSTGKAVFSGSLSAVDGTFTGTLQAGDITISNNLIEVDSAAGELRFTENGVKFGDISAFSGFLSVSADNFVSISSSTGTISTGAGGITLSTGSGVTLQTGTGLTVNQPTISSFNGLGTGIFSLTGMTICGITATTTQVTASTLFQVQSGATLFSIEPSGVSINGSPITTAGNISNQTITIAAGGPLGGGGSFTLNQGSPSTITITHDTSPQGSTAHSGGTVIQNVSTDGYGHITNVTAVNLDGRYLTSLPSHSHNDLYYTENEINNLLTGYATVAYVNSAVPTSSQITQWNAAYNFSAFGGTVSGNIYANDFILNSDASLKENVVDYAVKPINIAYKEYSFIGTQDKRVGVIAQELEVEHPEFIRESGLGKKSVSYIDLLLAKVAELESRIKQLEDGSGS